MSTVAPPVPVVLIDRLDEATAVLTLNRPDRRNAMTIEMMESLCRGLESLAAEPKWRAVILCASGPAFCAGLDLYEAADADRTARSAELVAESYEALTSSPLITIAAVQGAAYAGGAGLLACCDFVLAASDVQICFPEVRRGLVPALAAAVLRTRLREADVRQLVLMAEPIDAHRALGMGLVDRVVAGRRLLPEAEELAATLLKGAPNAVCQTKRLLRELRQNDPSEAFARALEFHKRARTGDEAREGLTAFRNRREPHWPAVREAPADQNKAQAS